MRIEQIGIGAAARQMYLLAGRHKAKLLLQQGQCVIAIVQARPEIDLPSQAPASSLVATDF